MRTDISPNLVHFTSGPSLEDSYARFRSIIHDRKIIGSAEKIKGGYQCVCFSEAPLPVLSYGLVNQNSYSTYAPFGFLFAKSYIYSLGGRPVIYQPDSDFSYLSPAIQWRHMRFELGGAQPIDFTWEREWRVLAIDVAIDPAYTHLVFPNQAWLEHFRAEHHSIEMSKVQQYAQMMPFEMASMYYEPFKWTAWTLS
jgi:hypothetical protein